MRAELQNIAPMYERAQINTAIKDIVEFISTQIIRFARSPVKRSHQIYLCDIQRIPTGYISTPFLSLLDEILIKMKERFPDTTFTIDPARTCIFVDWS